MERREQKHDVCVLWNACPCVIQAHAWTALGKLCLVDERLAKACVPHFARQLRAAPEPAVRNNIAVGLTDLCITYTGAGRLLGRLKVACPGE